MSQYFKILLVLVAALCAACKDSSSGSQQAAQERPQKDDPSAAGAAIVKTVAPDYRMRTAALETSGKIQFNEERLVRVNAPLTGRVLEILARPGDFVEGGHELFVIDSPDLGAAKSDYLKAVSDLQRSEKALNLARDLLEIQGISQKEVREAENDYRKAVAEKERAGSRLVALGIPEAQLKELTNRADANTRILVRTPRGGVIVERNVSPGQVVAFGQSDTPTSLFVIADLSTMWVIADVYEPDVSKVHLGQTISVTPPCCPSERVQAKVTYISDSVDPQTRTVKVRGVVPNPKRMLKSEMFVKVSIAAPSQKVLVIPQSAILRENNETFVFIEKTKGNYERRAIKLGADLDGGAEVLAGVTPEDRVVSTGSILLKGRTR